MILVVGSTGSLGALVVRGLLASQKPVAALVRDIASDSATRLRAAGAALVPGDLKSGSTLEAAVRGIDTVVCTASSTLSRQPGDSIETVDRAGIAALIDFAEAAKVRRFVFVSFSRNIPNDFPLAAAKRAAEERLESSSMDYTLLLPSYFAETWFSVAVGFDMGNGHVRVYGDGRSKVSYVAREDVARATIACIDNPLASRAAIPIGGPTGLSQLEAVALAEKATGKTMRIELMSTQQIDLARSGAQDSLTASFLGLFAALARGDEVPAGWADLLGVRPRSMPEWFSAQARLG